MTFFFYNPTFTDTEKQEKKKTEYKKNCSKKKGTFSKNFNFCFFNLILKAINFQLFKTAPNFDSKKFFCSFSFAHFCQLSIFFVSPKNLLPFFGLKNKIKKKQKKKKNKETEMSHQCIIMFHYPKLFVNLSAVHFLKTVLNPKKKKRRQKTLTK